MKKSRGSRPAVSGGGYDCVIVTGLSGAGKSVALRALEDLGYFCIDNLPLPLLPSLIRFYRGWGQRLRRIALGVDVRTGLPAREFRRSLENLRREGFQLRVLFLDSDNTTLLRRFSETRRRHPLGGTILGGLRRERRLLRDIKMLADWQIDTSRLAPSEVKEIVVQTLGLRHPQGMTVQVMSFGYKYGIPLDADLVWDVRFLPNPNYVPQLRARTGKDNPVSRYVLRDPTTQKFMAHLRQMMEFLLERFVLEGKSYLTVSVGCTGGRHRSVAVAEALADFIRTHLKMPVRVQHRDIARRG
ncbi:MAG TPA: RNase adapter RapZ [Elusimicrobiota bacterium]|nr:RNase adapter RapZ [Elusimicrobiota bacterium]